MWPGLKTVCYHSLKHIDNFLKDIDQWQSHDPVWCGFVCTICVVEIGVDGSIVDLPFWRDTATDESVTKSLWLKQLFSKLY